jgi:hypothetical protein
MAIDDRNWAEKRIDARRDEQGLPTGSATHNRIVTGALLSVIGLGLVALSESLGVAIGVLCLVGAAYQLLVLAISKGVREGRD